MSAKGWGEAIDREVASWNGVEGRPHRFGGREYRVGRREIGHVHGDHLVDVPLPRRERDRVVREGRAEPHHILPESGWVSLFLRTDEDVARGIELLRLSYDLALDQRRKRQAADPGLSEWSQQPATREKSTEGEARP